MTVGNSTVLFDVGDTAGFDEWKHWYNSMNRPVVTDIFLSHDHADHIGALNRIIEETNFSGSIWVNPFADTVTIRNSVSKTGHLIQFLVLSANDTLTILNAIRLKCFWPNKPDSIFSPVIPDANNQSLCLKMQYQNTAILLTGDIDSISGKIIAITQKTGVRSDVFIIPHHGSRGSLCPLFFGEVHATFGVISCGKDNGYGHPHDEVIQFCLFHCMMKIFRTDEAGAINLVSNGEYMTTYQE
jgi:competence protein ComEC